MYTILFFLIIILYIPILFLPPLIEHVKLKRFKSKLKKGTMLLHTYTKDEFSHPTSKTYTVLQVGKKQVQLMDITGYKSVKDIEYMTNKDWKILPYEI